MFICSRRCWDASIYCCSHLLTKHKWCVLWGFLVFFFWKFILLICLLNGFIESLYVSFWLDRQKTLHIPLLWASTQSAICSWHVMCTYSFWFEIIVKILPETSMKLYIASRSLEVSAALSTIIKPSFICCEL